MPCTTMKDKSKPTKKLPASRKALLEDYYSNALMIAAILDTYRPEGSPGLRGLPTRVKPLRQGA